MDRAPQRRGRAGANLTPICAELALAREKSGPLAPVDAVWKRTTPAGGHGSFLRGGCEDARRRRREQTRHAKRVMPRPWRGLSLRSGPGRGQRCGRHGQVRWRLGPPRPSPVRRAGDGRGRPPGDPSGSSPQFEPAARAGRRTPGIGISSPTCPRCARRSRPSE